MTNVSVLDERIDLIDGIASVIQRVYGDAVQTELDRRAAAEIWRYLEERGVAPLQLVAALVDAAGGSIELPDRMRADPLELARIDTPFGMRFETRRRP